jgi:thioredoxin 1
LKIEIVLFNNLIIKQILLIKKQNKIMALQLTDGNINEIINSGKPVVIDFWAEWCGPCRMVGPIIEELSKEYEGKVIVGKMDVDENIETPQVYGIRNIPTILFFKDGKVVDKQIGATQKAVFTAKIEALL